MSGYGMKGRREACVFHRGLCGVNQRVLNTCYHFFLDGFIEDMPNQISSVKEALDEGDSSLVQRPTHTIKGASGNVGATALQGAALQVEKAGKELDLANSALLIPKMDEQFEILKEAIARQGV
jgi:HPt (histidine-containing phosphotransfer) domain-containing protein